MKNLLNQLENQDMKKNCLLERLSNVSEEKLYWKESSSAWSIVEVVHHLVLSEKVVIIEPFQAANGIPRDKTVPQSAMYYAIILILRFNIPVPIPSEALAPDINKSLTELQNEWDATRKWIKKHITSMNSEAEKLAYFFHPVCGPLTTQEALTMSEYHFNLHEKQINRILKMSGYVS